ncbi:hypothetical protein VM77_08135 [Citromicrobium sp. JL31]|nr:hypothetical protein WG74_15370 [Citromicrobium sp. JL477]KPM16227.1 hypothetical protein VO58_06880 [Citromicrobium sp. JL1351]KPM19310.1 hypothetical protein VM77_08135 [Citromicrobium sp. JL31]KPM23867.1 hypothetical protein VO57_10060 [Citromicrobium sp. JL2201]
MDEKISVSHRSWRPNPITARLNRSDPVLDDVFFQLTAANPHMTVDGNAFVIAPEDENRNRAGTFRVKQGGIYSAEICKAGFITRTLGGAAVVLIIIIDSARTNMIAV